MKKILLGLITILIMFFGCSKEEPLEVVEGKATYYGKFFHGKKTKSGEIFDMNKMTAAHPTFPLGTKVKVINLSNERSVEVVINDRMRTKSKKRIDLSKAAFEKISEIDSGKIRVRMEVWEWGKK